MIAVIWDVWERRIPNAVCGAIAVSGIGVQYWDAGIVAAIAALAVGVGTIAALMVFWRSGGIGGGDVKLAGAVAVWVGPGSLLTYWLAAALAGGFVAAICFFASRRAVRREIRDNLTLAALHQMMPDVAPTAAVGRITDNGVATARIGAIPANAVNPGVITIPPPTPNRPERMPAASPTSTVRIASSGVTRTSSTTHVNDDGKH